MTGTTTMTQSSDQSPAAARLIEFRNLSREYGNGKSILRALDNVSVTIGRGGFVAVLGRSGSGKSTLMNVLGGLDRPTSGTVTVDGRELGRMSSGELARYRAGTVGFVFQSFHLMPRYKAWENVALPLVFAGASAAERRARAMPLLELVGLGARADHTPAEMSGGEQQRVAVARALVLDPPLLLCDEPTGNLDSANSARVMDVIRTAHARGTTVMIVTHDEALAQANATRIIRMADGRVSGDERVSPVAA